MALAFSDCKLQFNYRTNKDEGENISFISEPAVSYVGLFQSEIVTYILRMLKKNCSYCFTQEVNYIM